MGTVVFCVAVALLLWACVIRIPTFEDAQVSGQILSDFQSMAQTNSLFDRIMTRRQQQPQWADRHVEIGTSSRHKFTRIYVLGDLNESEEDVLQRIASKLAERYSRQVELKFDRPASNSELFESTNPRDPSVKNKR